MGTEANAVGGTFTFDKALANLTMIDTNDVIEIDHRHKGAICASTGKHSAEYQV
jgi:hypothetical protein